MLQRKGDIVWWSIRELETTKEKLVDLGVPSQFIPRNDFKSALIKALIKITTKKTGVRLSKKKIYKRYKDQGRYVRFGVYEWQFDPTGELALPREIVVTLDKDVGVVTSDTPGEFFDEIKATFMHEKTTINSKQLRTVLSRIIRRTLRGVQMRDGGGVYYIDKSQDHKREELLKVFREFSVHARLHVVPANNDAQTSAEIERATTVMFVEEVDALIKDINQRFESGRITRRQLENQQQRIDEILQRHSENAENMRTQAQAIKAKLLLTELAVKEVMGRVDAGIIEPQDFMNALGAL